MNANEKTEVALPVLPEIAVKRPVMTIKRLVAAIAALEIDIKEDKNDIIYQLKHWGYEGNKKEILKLLQKELAERQEILGKAQQILLEESADNPAPKRQYNSTGGNRRKVEITQINLETGLPIKTFGSITEAALAVCGGKKGLVPIQMASMGKTKTAYGFGWTRESAPVRATV